MQCLHRRRHRITGGNRTAVRTTLARLGRHRRRCLLLGQVIGLPLRLVDRKLARIATQQADVIAAVLARRAGAAVEPPSGRSVLRARLLGTDLPCFLRSELDELGRPLPTAAGAAVSEEAEWWPPAKLFGRHLTPWMATRGLLPV